MSRSRGETGHVQAGREEEVSTSRFVDPQEGVFVSVLLAGLVVILLMWLFVQALSGALAEAHLRHKVSGLAGQVVRALAQGGWDGRGALSEAAAAELKGLVRHTDAERLLIADSTGRVLWSSEEDGVARRLAVERKTPLALRLETVRSGEIRRKMARALVRAGMPGGKSVIVAVDLDATGTLAWYRQIGAVFAKVMTVLIAAAMLLVGLVMHRRLRERLAAMMELEALRRRNDEEHRRVEALQMQLVRLQEEMAALNRRLARAMRQGAGRGDGQERDPEGNGGSESATGGDGLRESRSRSAGNGGG